MQIPKYTCSEDAQPISSGVLLPADRCSPAWDKGALSVFLHLNSHPSVGDYHCDRPGGPLGGSSTLNPTPDRQVIIIACFELGSPSLPGSECITLAFFPKIVKTRWCLNISWKLSNGMQCPGFHNQ